MEIGQYLSIHESFILVVYKLLYHKFSTCEYWSDNDLAPYSDLNSALFLRFLRKRHWKVRPFFKPVTNSFSWKRGGKMSSEWSLVWSITTALRSLWKKSHTFPEKTLAHFLTPSPKIKKFTLKKFLIFFRKKNSYILGLMLIKCKISYIPYTPGWLLIKHRIKQNSHNAGWLLI